MRVKAASRAVPSSHRGTSHRHTGGRRRRRGALLLALVVAHVAAVAGVSAVLVEQPADLVAAGTRVAEDVAQDVVGRPGLLPAQRPVLSAVSPVPERASGHFDVAPLTTRSVPAAGALTYRVEAERGLPYDVAGFAHTVDRTLADPRSWAGSGQVDLARVDGEADFRIVLASPKTVDRLCAPLDTQGKVSCRNGDDVVINAWRWWRGAKSYGDDVDAYRTYVINHEVGHFLGHSHVGCPGAGKPAPVMHQQTLGLGGCVANPWPTKSELH
jgi:hypothetical protein